MRLHEAVTRINELDPDMTIYIEPPWSSNSRVTICNEPDSGESPDGFEYFLEVFIVQDLFEDLPSLSVERVIEYAQNDA
ncbi:hypothetical protein [Vibrio sp. WXL103]|uniref:hypothetical protein n=1 Tax=Vibrio sp. WXL103 TaxID=3450710 RepID=UPI003EC88E92